MNVLLINPPFVLSEDSPYSKTGAVLPPLGLLYIAAYLRDKHPEFNINVLDAASYKYNLVDDGFKERLSGFLPDVVGITVYTTTFSAVLKTVEIVKELFPNCVVVVGGAHVSIKPEECLDYNGIDVAVIGEGEITFNELVECLSCNGDLDNVNNIVYKRDNNKIKTNIDGATGNLDVIPIPARDMIDMKLYRPAKGVYKRLPSANMITARGCPFSCNFCSKNIFGNKARYQSPENIIKEIEALQRDYGIREIAFNDDSFTLSSKRVELLCDLIVQKKLDLTWNCGTRVNLVNPELLKKMKRGGCFSIGYGIESGSPDILKKIQKGITLQNVRDAFKWTKKAGIETRASFIFGLPGETKKTIQQTIDFSLELDADFVIYNIAIPLPGTKIYDEAKAKNLLLYDGLELYERADGPHPLIKLSDVTSEELVQLYNSAYRKYYIRPKYIFNQFKRIRSLKELNRYVSGFVSFLKWFK
jgi:radical SAM superfamily enzyme YgiQ (UPF0313 family)